MDTAVDTQALDTGSAPATAVEPTPLDRRSPPVSLAEAREQRDNDNDDQPDVDPRLGRPLGPRPSER